jgi:LAS superfamily LD-carboxypeptidase LdcB
LGPPDPTFPALLHGLLDTGQLARYEGSVHLHQRVIEPLRALVAAAAQDSIELRVCSGHRSFERQLGIWNRKATGGQALRDSYGRPIDATTLPPDALIDAILRWSALPGASRHHWGTDMDVYDAGAVAPGYEPELTEEESATRFHDLHQWLDTHMHAFGFYRPYARDLGGVAPEPWHLSYAPVATGYLAALSVDTLREVLRPAEMALKERVLERLPELFERYTLRVAPPEGL